MLDAYFSGVGAKSPPQAHPKASKLLFWGEVTAEDVLPPGPRLIRLDITFGCLVRVCGQFVATIGGSYQFSCAIEAAVFDLSINLDAMLFRKLPLRIGAGCPPQGIFLFRRYTEESYLGSRKR